MRLTTPRVVVVLMSTATAAMVGIVLTTAHDRSAPAPAERTHRPEAAPIVIEDGAWVRVPTRPPSFPAPSVRSVDATPFPVPDHQPVAHSPMPAPIDSGHSCGGASYADPERDRSSPRH